MKSPESAGPASSRINCRLALSVYVSSSSNGNLLSLGGLFYFLVSVHRHNIKHKVRSQACYPCLPFIITIPVILVKIKEQKNWVIKEVKFLTFIVSMFIRVENPVTSTKLAVIIG